MTSYACLSLLTLLAVLLLRPVIHFSSSLAKCCSVTILAYRRDLIYSQKSTEWNEVRWIVFFPINSPTHNTVLLKYRICWLWYWSKKPQNFYGPHTVKLSSIKEFKTPWFHPLLLLGSTQPNFSYSHTITCSIKSSFYSVSHELRPFEKWQTISMLRKAMSSGKINE